MIYNEAKWIKESLEILPIEGKSILNVGSSNENYRKHTRSFINDLIFEPLINRNVIVIHTDIKKDLGIDIIGDLTDKTFLLELKQLNCFCVLCNNLLEHILDRDEIYKTLQYIVHEEGYLLITVPYRYPYHYDPIDSMFRPSINELISKFKDFKLITGEIINDERTYWDMLRRDKRLLIIIFVRSLLPFYKPKMWWNTVSYLPNLFKKFQVTCVLLKKIKYL